MLNWVMKKLGFVSIDEAEKYDFTLVYQLDGKTHNKKIIEYFNDDGLVFICRKDGFFTLDDISVADVKIIKFDGQIVYSLEDNKSKMEYTDKLELMIYLYSDIVENRPKIDNYLYRNVINKFRMATSYNRMRNEKDIDSAIAFMKNDVWKDLYGKRYDEYLEVS